MEINPLSFDKRKIIIKRDNILKGMDVPLNSSDDYTNQLIDKLISKSLELANPKADIGIFSNVSVNNARELQVYGQIFTLGNIVLTALKKSDKIALFACTAGIKIEEYSKQLINKGEMLEALIVDLIGSEIAEETAEIAHQHILSEVKKQGLNGSNRYSPGYCNWPVSDQHKLFNLLKTTNSKIQLSASALMKPIKSVSGIIGIGKAIKKRPYACAVCKNKVCIYRDKQNSI